MTILCTAMCIVWPEHAHKILVLIKDASSEGLDESFFFFFFFFFGIAEFSLLANTI